MTFDDQNCDREAEHGELDLIEFVLGRGTPSERDAARTKIASDLGAAVELAEVKDLFETMRSLRGAPSGTLLSRLDRQFTWRARLLARGAERTRFPISAWLKVAALAAVWLLASDFLFLRMGRTDGSDRRREVIAGLPDPRTSESASRRDDPAAALAFVLPVTATEFREAWTRLASRPLPADFADWSSPERVLAKARAVAELRDSPLARATWRSRSGAADVDARVTALALEVAARARVALEDGDGDPEALAFSVRALLASGAGARIDVHRPLLERICHELVERVDLLADGPRATVLAALAEFAVVDDSDLSAIVARQSDRLIASICAPRADLLRPEMLRWSQPAYRLAEAGRLLLLAPAFGADAGGAFRARLLLAAHLEERTTQRRHEETPELAAALLYGFADVVDRTEADRRLALWPARLMLPDYLAVSHLTWSSYPIRHGWAALQDQIRGLSGVRPPPGILDSAALLLALCSEIAVAERGPGSPAPVVQAG